MCPPHTVNKCRTPACRSVRATRCPPVSSDTRLALRDVDNLELEPVGVLEEDRVVAVAVFGELPRRVVQRGNAARPEEVAGEAVDIVPLRHAEGDVVDP